MRIFRINILSNNVLKTANAVCFTSNGITKKDGRLVMGAGVAKQFRDFFVGLDQEAGTIVKAYGHKCQIIRDTLFLGNPLSIVSFPTKWDWKNKSDLGLIEKSTNELIDMTNKYGWKMVYLPAPGCSNGGLSWDKDVRPLLESKLDDRFVITFYGKGK